MKEFINKHPWLTLFGVGTIVDGMVTVVDIIVNGRNKGKYLKGKYLTESTTEEEHVETKES